MASIDAVAPGSRFFTAATAPLTEPVTAVAAEEIIDGFLGCVALPLRVFMALRAFALRVVLALRAFALRFVLALRVVLRDAVARAALRRLAAFAVERRARVFAVFFAAVLRRV